MPWIDFHLSIAKRPDQITLDHHQVRVRNTALNAHALVRGAAGSGKSLILRARLQRILQETNYSSILIVTFNRFMAAWVRHLVVENSNRNIICSTFNTWAYHKLGYNYKNPATDFERKSQKTKITYDAILIDEAQDFKDEWFTGLLNILNPTTNSLFLAYDNAQSVYGNQHRRKPEWTWRKIGIDVVGRSEILDICYRSSPEIIAYSWKFIVPFLKKEKIPISRTNVAGVVEPKTIKQRSSRVPVQIIHCNNAEVIAKEVGSALKTEPDSSIAILMHPDVLFRTSTQRNISKSLSNLRIQHHAPSESIERDGNVVTRPCVVVDSWNAVKGVEFDAVILVAVEYLDRFVGTNDEFKHMAGFYSSMTRARDHLVITHTENNKFVDNLVELLM